MTRPIHLGVDVSGWRPAPPPPIRYEWCRWHVGWVIADEAVMVGHDACYAFYACQPCMKEHRIRPADDTGEIRCSKPR